MPTSIKNDVRECDALVVGGGFSGIAAMYKLRKLGLKVRGFEGGANFGGVWFWNRYPGARVDSECPFYQLNIPEVWRTWNWSVRYPDHNEIREYMKHVETTLDLRKDFTFDALVCSATYDTTSSRWTVSTEAGHTAICKYLVLATGLLHRKHFPDFAGLEDYTKGTILHSGSWPEGTSVKGKKVAVIGAGATGVQIVQELSKQADHLSVLMRRPSYCLPMQQRFLGKEEQVGWKSYYPRLFAEGRKSAAGFPIATPNCNLDQVPDAEREEYFEELWSRGGFNYMLGQYNDVMLDLKANRAVYDFWKTKTRARISNPIKREMMAPLDPPYPILTKRSPLEQDYYESLDQDNVELIDLNTKSIERFVQEGIRFHDGTTQEYDYVILATGFDSFTGS